MQAQDPEHGLTNVLTVTTDSKEHFMDITADDQPLLLIWNHANRKLSSLAAGAQMSAMPGCEAQSAWDRSTREVTGPVFLHAFEIRPTGNDVYQARHRLGLIHSPGTG